MSDETSGAIRVGVTELKSHLPRAHTRAYAVFSIWMALPDAGCRPGADFGSFRPERLGSEMRNVFLLELRDPSQPWQFRLLGEGVRRALRARSGIDVDQSALPQRGVQAIVACQDAQPRLVQGMVIGVDGKDVTGDLLLLPFLRRPCAFQGQPNQLLGHLPLRIR